MTFDNPFLPHKILYLDLDQNEWEISYKVEISDNFHLYMSGKEKDNEEISFDKNPGKENTNLSNLNTKDQKNIILIENSYILRK